MKILDLNPKRMAIRFAIIASIFLGVIFFTPYGAYFTGNDVVASDQKTVEYEYNDEYGVASTHFYAMNADVTLGLTCYDGVHGIYVQRPGNHWEEISTARAAKVKTYTYENPVLRSGDLETVGETDMQFWKAEGAPSMVFNEGEGFGTEVPVNLWKSQVVIVEVATANNPISIDWTADPPHSYRFELGDKGRQLVKKYVERENC